MVGNKEMLYQNCFFNFALVYTMRVQVNQDGLKLNGTHQLLVYADDVYIHWEEVYIL